MKVTHYPIVLSSVNHKKISSVDAISKIPNIFLKRKIIFMSFLYSHWLEANVLDLKSPHI